MAIRCLSFMVSFHFLIVQEIKPKVLIEVIITTLIIIILTELILGRVHLDLHSLFASPWIRDEIFFKLRRALWRWLLSWRGGWLLRRLGGRFWWSGLLRSLCRLRWSWFGLRRIGWFDFRFRLFRRLLFWLLLCHLLRLFLLFLSFGGSLVLVSLLEHLAHHEDGLVSFEIIAITWFLLIVGFRLLRLLWLRILWLGLLRLLWLGLLRFLWLGLLWLFRLGLLWLFRLGLLWLFRLGLLRLLRLGLLRLFRLRSRLVHFSCYTVPVHIRL